jgi:hypothetical protein
MSEIKLEAVYYSAPFPRSFEALTLMGLVFDRIHLPYVSVPREGFEVSDVVARQEKLNDIAAADRSSMRADTVMMINALQFMQWREWTEEFLFYPHADDINLWKRIDDEIPDALPMQIYDLTFPPRENFHPIMDSAHTFGVTNDPSKGPSIAYPGRFHYPAGAAVYALNARLPLINDVQMLGMPRLSANSVKNDATVLASILAVECVQFVLPQAPVLDITELLDFRDEMKPHTTAFRLALLRLTEKLNNQIVDGATAEDIASAARFIVESQIQPLLVELKAFSENPARPWYKRALGLGQPLQGYLTGEYWSLPPEAQLAGIAQRYAAMLTKGVGDERAKQDAIRRSPMYYLLRMSDLPRPIKS